MKNKDRVEGSICEAYLVEETSTFVLFYYPNHVETRRTNIPHNLEVGEGSSCTPPTLIFDYLGREIRKSMTYYMNQRDFDVAQLYVLQNCEEVQPYFE